MHSALEILSPDQPEDVDNLELLTQTVLDSTLEPGSVSLGFSRGDLEQCIAALEIINPDEIEKGELAVDMFHRLRAAYDDIDVGSPGI